MKALKELGTRAMEQVNGGGMADRFQIKTQVLGVPGGGVAYGTGGRPGALAPNWQKLAR